MEKHLPQGGLQDSPRPKHTTYSSIGTAASSGRMGSPILSWRRAVQNCYSCTLQDLQQLQESPWEKALPPQWGYGSLHQLFCPMQGVRIWRWKPLMAASLGWAHSSPPSALLHPFPNRPSHWPALLEHLPAISL